VPKVKSEEVKEQMAVNALRQIIISMRPAHWVKNFFVFTPLVFSQNLFHLKLLFLTSGAFLIFCAVSGAAYIINDLIDRDDDRIHPAKAKRPIASEKLSFKAALFSALMLQALGLVFAWALSPRLVLVAVFYIALNLLYSFFLKKIVILDVMAIAAGFILRILAGSAVTSVLPSHWLTICTGAIAIFLALGKRRHELILQNNLNGNNGKYLSYTSPYFLDQMIAVVTASTLMSYVLYTISAETIEKFGTTNLSFTIPFVVYGIFRYLYLMHQKGKGDDPARIMISDWPMILNLILWSLTVIWVLYQ